jgi:inner membrane transporter RhtA
VLPYIMEMRALRRMTHTAFGTLLALEPAIGLLLGMIVLAQSPSALQLLGIVLVVFAGAAAQRGGRRQQPGGASQCGRLAEVRQESARLSHGADPLA